ncbi:hypothetical protein [Streptomyces sp. NPDC058307]|uniref:hypothetical protein n=1 Tax=Streptomyces sp. NPDC058307 TaxID=3346439 RepID=UPI0036E13BA6
MSSSSAYAKVNALDTYYETHGAAPEGSRPLVLLHGGGLTVGLTFSAVLPALAAGRRVRARRPTSSGSASTG